MPSLQSPGPDAPLPLLAPLPEMVKAPPVESEGSSGSSGELTTEQAAIIPTQAATRA
jgi:hypothetical protein